jgi:hypothetical protein
MRQAEAKDDAEVMAEVGEVMKEVGERRAKALRGIVEHEGRLETIKHVQELLDAWGWPSQPLSQTEAN